MGKNLTHHRSIKGTGDRILKSRTRTDFFFRARENPDLDGEIDKELAEGGADSWRRFRWLTRGGQRT